MGLLAWLNQGRRISELESVVTKLNSKMEECELDWVEMRARCKRLLDRTEKAARRVDEGEVVVDSTQAGTNGETPTPGNTIGYSGRLSDHQKQIQQQILKRRGGG
jgi:HAMP domain-containing protein